MRLIDELRAEHDLIERVAGSLRTFARQRARGEGAPNGPRFLAFFRLYAGQFHHAREEDTLFVALQRDAELPGDRGPIAALLEDHRRMAGLLDRMEPVTADSSAEARASLEAIALEYSQQLWQHIDAEELGGPAGREPPAALRPGRAAHSRDDAGRGRGPRPRREGSSPSCRP